VPIQPLTRSSGGKQPYYFKESHISQGGPFGSKWCAEKEPEKRYKAGVAGLENKLGIDSKESVRRKNRGRGGKCFRVVVSSLEGIVYSCHK